jgi:2,4-dienoyl-CoA reductase-like NADH-dependent reductase (Old Yellow Enzyme family)
MSQPLLFQPITLRSVTAKNRILLSPMCQYSAAFSSEVDTGSREENASKQESRASVLIQSEPTLLSDAASTARR